MEDRTPAADFHFLMSSGGGGLHDEGVGYQQWMQGQQQMPAPGAHPAVLQAMLQAAAVGGQCMPPMAAMYMAAAFGGRPPGLPPLQQQVCQRPALQYSLFCAIKNVEKSIAV